MKNINSILLGLVVLTAFVVACLSVSVGNFEVSSIAFIVVMAAMTFIPSSGKKHTSLGFMNKSYFNAQDEPYSRAEIALVNYLVRSGKAQSQADFSSGKLKLETYARAFRFVIPNAFSGRRELLNAASVFIQGAIPEEFNLGQLPDGYNIAVTHVRTGFVADAVVTTGQAAIALASQPNGYPAALRNGQLIFSQAGAIKTFVDVVLTGTMAAGFGSIGENDGLELQAPFILEENKATKFELYGSSGLAFASPAGANILEVILYGAMVRLRA